MNCQLCEKGYYRPAGVSRFDSEPCAACDCDTFGSVGVWDGFLFNIRGSKDTIHLFSESYLEINGHYHVTK